MVDAESPSTSSAARYLQGARYHFPARIICRLVAALLLGACVVQPVLLASRAGASSLTDSLQAEAAQLSQQLVQEQLQVNTLEHQYELDSITIYQDAAAIAVVRHQIDNDQLRVHTDRVRLSEEAVSAYVNAGSSALNPTLSLFETNRQALGSRSEYENVAIGNTTVTLAALHTDQVRLDQAEAELTIRAGQDRAAQAAAASDLGRAQQVTAQLSSQQAMVNGQLAEAIAAERALEAAAAAATRQAAAAAATRQAEAASVGTPAPAVALSDPPLPPFLQCALQVESSGNYQAVSPNGQYMGGFQFLQSTWNLAAQLAGLPQLIGVPPNQASKAEQDTLAVALYNAEGERPWLGDCGS